MSKTENSTGVDKLGDIFVSVTGDDVVTESQDEAAQQSDREVPDGGGRVEIEDGLDDAIDGTELGGTDPVG